jgi:hypothetical protein
MDPIKIFKKMFQDVGCESPFAQQRKHMQKKG